MIEIIKAVVLGIIQGLTEFLPVSSSGHLVLYQYILNVNLGEALFFDVMLHIATLAAVVVYFRKDILQLIKFPLKKEVRFLILSAIPAALAAFLLRDLLEDTFNGIKILPYTFLITAAVLLFADYYLKRGKQNTEINIKSTSFMGVAQALALLPGLSRSGFTISGGIFSGLNKDEAARFSFLMSIPIIFGSALFETISLFSVNAQQKTDFLPLFFSMIFAFVFGLIAIKYMLNVVKKAGFKVFSAYLFLLSLFIILFL